ncbi:MAG: LemA family protein [Lentisphaeria bacterium]|jgi:LemA protein|nr:LemA family protein [Lentisphaeria bacterium]NLZ60621.1 LemA family protein [Lentisphaerota bacterium]
MKKTIIIIVLALLALFLLAASWVISSRNSLINQDEAVNLQWSEIDTQLQRRSDLIPNLVNTVKGYAAHESEIFTAVADARSKLIGASTPAEKAGAETAVSSALSRLLAIAENYPQLKADSSFVRLQDELAGTENRIAVARGRYNGAVKNFNAAIRMFPGSLFAPGLGFSPAEYYEPPAGRAALEQAPEVSF